MLSVPTKPFTFSYSRLKNFEVCGFRHLQVDILKSVREEESEILRWGNLVHKALAARLGKKTPLPEGMTQFEEHAVRLEKVPGEVRVEQQLAITKDFAPTGWFDKNVWFRAVADVIIINPPVALAIDYKLGKVVEDSQQLALLAACVFAHNPEVRAIRSEFWWFKEGCETREDFKRESMPDMWKRVWPRIEALQKAHETQTYLKKPGGLCRRYCPVRSCEHYGE